MNVLLFIVFLGGLILVHEFGHYIAARLTGVFVKVFSIGFGPRILGVKVGETDYRISAVPLGGYVRFLGDDPEELPPPELARRGFLTTDLWRKLVIVLAGPVLNLFLPFAVFWSLQAATSELPPAVIGTVAAGGPGERGGLKPGDRVVAIDGQRVEYWWEMRRKIASLPDQDVQLTVERGSRRLSIVVKPRAVNAGPLAGMGLGREEGRIEVSADWELPVVLVKKGSKAYELGFRPFDILARVDGQRPMNFLEAERLLREARSDTVKVVVHRVSRNNEKTRFVLTVPREVGLRQLGIRDGTMTVRSVEPGSPAEKAGMRPMDRIVELDGRSVHSWIFFQDRLYRHGKGTHRIVVERDGAKVTLGVDLTNPDWSPGATVPRLKPLGASYPLEVAVPERVPNHSRLRYALVVGTQKAISSVVTTVTALYAMLAGKVSVKQLGGPIMVYDVAVKAGRKGLKAFLRAMAWISASLGVLNLLPIPVLDGGHLMIFFIEAVRRRPLGRRGRQYAAYVGLAFLAVLMVIVFVNDIQRKFGIRF